MSWTLNGTRIYVDKLANKKSQVIARLQPLSGETILHIFGYEGEVVSMGGLVATSGDMSALLALTTTGLAYTLVSPEGSLGDFYVKDVKYDRQSTTCIRLFDRPELEDDIPVYKVDIEIFAT
jgi:hypothetical protein